MAEVGLSKWLAKKFLTPGNGSSLLAKIIEGGLIAVAAGMISMYGTTARINGQVERLCAEVSGLTQAVHQHMSDYNIHVPHRR